MARKTKPTLLAALDAHERGVTLVVDNRRCEAHCEGSRAVGMRNDVVDALLDMASDLFGRTVRATPEEVELLSRLDVSGEPLYFYVAAEEDPQRWDVGRDYTFGSGDTLVEAIREHLALKERAR